MVRSGFSSFARGGTTPHDPCGERFCSVAGTVRESVHGGATFISWMTKAELHELVDALPTESIEAAGVLLRRAQDPVLAQLDAAPYDDEPLTDEDRLAVE